MQTRYDNGLYSDETVVLQIRWALAALKFEVAMMRVQLLLRAYNPNQPRVPAGNPDGGQWADGGFQRLKPHYDPGRLDGEARVRVAGEGDGLSPLRRIHPDATYESDAGARRSLRYWQGQSTETIVESLKSGMNKDEFLKATADGRILNGNTRIKILQERGYDVNSLPRIHSPTEPPAGSNTRGGGRGGGGAGLPGLDGRHPTGQRLKL